MKRTVLLTLCTLAAALCFSVLGADAARLQPMEAKEGVITMWVFIAVIVIAAAAGVVYFVIHNKKK